MIISHSLKYVFFAVPKTGSVSVSTFLQENVEGNSFGNYHNVVIPENCIDYFTFCTVRHPYTRALSFYQHIKNHSEHRCHAMVNSMSFENYVEWLCDHSKKPEFLFSEDDFISNQNTGFFEREFFRQSISLNKGRELNQCDYLSYAVAINYLPKIDFVIRLESINEDFCKLPFINKDATLKCLNASEDKPELLSLLNERTENMIYKWAEEDFEVFSYERLF